MNDESRSAEVLRRDHDVVPLHAATRVWFLISLQTFGGPAGQIAVMHRTLVEERRWIGERRFLHALSYCTLLPGPEAQQLAVYVGWLLNGVRGGLVAGSLFVLPGVVALLLLSALYVTAGDSRPVAAVFAGLAPAVLAVVVQAVVRLGRRSLGHPALVALSVGAFLALALFRVAFPLVVAAAALAGWAVGRWVPQALRRREPETGGVDGSAAAPLVPDEALHGEPPGRWYAARVLGVGLLAWGLPLLAVAVMLGGDSIYTEQGLFFSGTALVTFGGAYAVLAYVAQRAVEVYGWLAPGDMVRGLALAESTPGPLIMVVQFVAFVGAYRAPGGLDPWLAGLLAALLTTWVTFVPSFVLVFLGAPSVERLRGNRTLTSALTGIMAAVVGVIAHLAVFFAVHTLFGDVQRRVWGPLAVDLPDLPTVRWLPLGLAVVAGGLLVLRRWTVLRTLGVCAALGLAAGLAGVPVS